MPNPNPNPEATGDESVEARFDSAMSQMKNALPDDKMQASTVPFRPYSCDIDGDSDKVFSF